MATVIAMVAVFASFSALAADSKAVHVADGLDYAIPHGSPVRFVSLGEYGVGLFQGRFVVSGTYHYGYLSNNPEADTEYGLLELYFIPDEETANHLPYWKQRGHVHEIRFRNDTDFVKALISPKTLRGLKKRTILSISGKAVVIAANYRISVECDYPTYSASFVAAERPEALLVSHALIEPGGC
ncbi:hypothetical protein [Rhodanobacter denitrificans]|uniref:Uncharacterized protein n=1 Tax=Rhodanobacter denitrificans TaxID=666685 RepID=M4NAA6_9GAMM|nr:hypothetical protein [Rhodanobacter denitrificans]AGG87359.1 hypothetical protein R2APBS1_0180 [Rhodanobacter denitrificans]UJM86542.1 hypothetical protein LRJ86_17475 [Rhodanobacter denitrificans]